MAQSADTTQSAPTTADIMQIFQAMMERSERRENELMELLRQSDKMQRLKAHSLVAQKHVPYPTRTRQS